MREALEVALVVIAGIVFVCVALFLLMRLVGRYLVHHPRDAKTRQVTKTPADYGMPYEDVTVTTEDGLKLVGWYVHSHNGALVMAQHGYKGSRENMLFDAEVLYRHGYGVLLSSVRAHDQSDGVLISFGEEEMKDLEAWYQYLLTREDLDRERIGAFGESMGGTLVIKYAAQNEKIKAVVTHSAVASLRDAAASGVRLETRLPPFPLAPIIAYWARREAGLQATDVMGTEYIGQISPRPVFIMIGGQDDHIPVDSGQRLYDAAAEPKELWFEPAAGHHGLPEVAPEEYERRVIAFFDHYLFGE